MPSPSRGPASTSKGPAVHHSRRGDTGRQQRMLPILHELTSSVAREKDTPSASKTLCAIENKNPELQYSPIMQQAQEGPVCSLVFTAEGPSLHFHKWPRTQGPLDLIHPGHLLITSSGIYLTRTPNQLLTGFNFLFLPTFEKVAEMGKKGRLKT